MITDPLAYQEEPIDGFVQQGNVNGWKYPVWNWQNEKHYVTISSVKTGNWYVQYANPKTQMRLFTTKDEAVEHANKIKADFIQAEEPVEAIQNECTHCCGTGKEPFPENSY